MANSKNHGILNVSPLRVTRFFLLTLIGIFAGFIFAIFSAGSANAAPTTVTGTITGIPDDSWGMAWGEKLVSGNWVEITSSYTKDLRKDVPYSVSLGEVTGSTVRIWAQFGSNGGGYIAGTDSFTVTSTSMTKNFTLSPFNYKLEISNPLACSTGFISITTLDDGFTERFSASAGINDTGVANLSLPSSVNYVFSGRCNGDITFAVNSLSTSNLQTIPVSIATPNVIGTISGVTSGNRIYGQVQSQIYNGIDTKWRNSEYNYSTNSSGQFALNLPVGTYRLGAQPNWEGGGVSEFVNSHSDTFTVTGSQSTVNFSMSSDPNLIYTVTPATVSSSGWVLLEEKQVHPKQGTSFNYLDGVNVNSEGKARYFLEPGTYRLVVYPNQNGDGYVRTVSPEFTITSGGADVIGTLALNQANLKFVVSPTANASGGSIVLTDSQGNEFEGYISESGISFIYVPAGTYTATISPGNPSITANTTILTGLSVTGSSQTVNVTLSSGNVSGTVSSTAVSAGGSIRVEQKMTGVKVYWKQLNIWSAIDENGTYSIALPEGTFRVWADSNDGSFISTPSPEFNVGSSAVVQDITLRIANITGTVSPTAKAANGYVYVSWQDVDSQQDYSYGAPIQADGTFKMALPNGRYKLKANSSGRWPNYFGVQSDSITVTSTPQVLDLTLQAANVSGVVNPTGKSKNGWFEVESLQNGNWLNTGTSYGVDNSGNYAIYLAPGTYRARINPNSSATGVYRLISDSFTVSAGSNTFDFTLPSSNFSATVTPITSSPGTQVLIEKVQSQGNFQFYDWANVNQSGAIEAYLPNGRYRLTFEPNGSEFVQTRSASFDIPTSGEFPVPTTIALATPNVTGTVTPNADAVYGQACLERKDNESFSYVTCKSLDGNGKFGFKVDNGTYRVIVTPASIIYGGKGGYFPGAKLDSPYTTTTSDEFTVNNDSKVINIALSTGNLSGTVSDIAKSAGGWIQVLKTDGAYPQWTNYRTNISSLGKYALQLPVGQYRLQIFPRDDATGVVRTETTDFTIAGSTPIEVNVTLDTPNVTGVITPIDKSANGWVYAEQYACKCGWSGWSGAPGVAASSGVKSDGSYAMKLDNGISRVIAFPRYDATGVTRTVSDTFTVTTGSSTNMSFALSEGNVRGTISSIANSAGGQVRVEKLVSKGDSSYWEWTNYGTQVLADGTYRLQVDDGTYRILVSPGWNATNVVETPSGQFTVAGDQKVVNLTLLAPNLTGTVSNLAAAVDASKLEGQEARYYPAAFAYILQKVGSGYVWINKYLNIYADGSYSTYLPDGTYQIYVYQINSLVSGLSRANSADIVISGSTNTSTFALKEANLKGTVTPANMAGWGWVCAQKQNGANWEWNACESIRQDGSYSLTVDPGVYRVIANPNWNSVGYSKIISDTATVGASGITTLNMALATTNVKLVINDLAGRPNYEGWVNVKDEAGNYVDTGKGWISQLGKVDFTLTTGVYTLEIQPANNRTGVRTTETITVTSGVLLQRTITLAAGNVQGLAKNSSGANISCAFITATAAGETTLKTISKSDGTYSLNLVAGKSWTISAVDPTSGQVGSATLTPNNTSSNALTVTTS
jgi:hypothetical protein